MRDAILQATSGLLARDDRHPSLDGIAAIVGVIKRAVQGYFSSTAAIENELIAHLDPESPRNQTQHPSQTLHHRVRRQLWRRPTRPT